MSLLGPKSQSGALRLLLPGGSHGRVLAIAPQRLLFKLLFSSVALALSLHMWRHR